MPKPATVTNVAFTRAISAVAVYRSITFPLIDRLLKVLRLGTQRKEVSRGVERPERSNELRDHEQRHVARPNAGKRV